MAEERLEFIGQPITPLAGTADVSALARGEPGLPTAFTWRGVRYDVGRVIKRWRTTSEDRGDVYVRRHWFEFETDKGHRMTVYCDRQAAGRAKRKARWWLYKVTDGPGKGPLPKT